MSNHIIVRPDGPLIVRGEIRLENASGQFLAEDNELYLCRCGKSASKPFCDGAHKSCGFSDSACFSDEKIEQLVDESGIVISLRENAMMIVKGPVTIQSEDGSSSTTRYKAALCRCGESANKPFCDASHKRCGFVSQD
jgi:CDGSH-type Zn-finger protein